MQRCCLCIEAQSKVFFCFHLFCYNATLLENAFSNLKNETFGLFCLGENNNVLHYYLGVIDAS